MFFERQELRIFRAVVDAGGFSRAAERMGLSQSAVSQAVANLEHKIGTQLLRRGSPPKVTEAGARVLRFAQSWSSAEASAIADLEEIRSGARSTLSVALSSAVNHRYGIELLRDFSERNPLARLKIDVAPSREIVYGVAEGRWELGFGPFQHRMPGQFALLPCFTEVRQLVIGAGHPAGDRLQGDPAAVLATLPLLTSFLDEPARRAGSDRAVGVPLREVFGSIWEISHMELRLQLVAEGKGVTYVSDLLLGGRGGLVPIDGLPYSRIERRVGLYSLKDRALSQAAQRFIAQCQARFQERA